MEENIKTNKVKYISMFSLAMTLVGCFIGVGSSTGREIMTYFGNFGKMGIVGIFISIGILVTLFTYMAFVTARNMGTTQFDYVSTPFGWKPLRIFCLYFSLIGLSSSICAMIAGSGAILSALFGVPYVVGAGLITLLCLFTVVLSLEKFANLMGGMITVMCVAAITICLVCIISPASEGGGGWDKVVSNSELIGNWFTSSLIYWGFAVGPQIQLIVSMSNKIKGKKTAATASIVCSVVLVIVAICVATAIVFNYDICSSAAMPTVTLGYAKFPVFGIIYGIVAMIAIYSTMTGFLFIFKEIFDKKIPALHKDSKKLVLVLFLLLAVCFGLSFIGYANFVDTIWAYLAFVGYIFKVGLIINFFYYRKHPKNLDTEVDNAEMLP